MLYVKLCASPGSEPRNSEKGPGAVAACEHGNSCGPTRITPAAGCTRNKCFLTNSARPFVGPIHNKKGTGWEKEEWRRMRQVALPLGPRHGLAPAGPPATRTGAVFPIRLSTGQSCREVRGPAGHDQKSRHRMSGFLSVF